MSQRKTILITGSSEGGIGDAIAQEFHRRGLRVFATARTLSKVAHLEAMGIETLTLEVTSAASIGSAVEKISTRTGGKLDYLFNNSGLGYSMPVTDVDLDEAKKIFDVNFFAIIAVTTAFMPLLIKAHGTVVNNTSIVALAPLPFLGVYNASKAAADCITHDMRLEFKPLGVQVVDVRSGIVRTKLFEKESAREIPENSYYAPAKKEIEFVMTGKTVEGKDQDMMEAAVYAKKVAGDVLKSSPSSVLWRGGSASIVWFVTTFFSRGLQDVVLIKLTGLDLIARTLRGRNGW